MRRISSGSPFEAEMGYSRAVVKGGWCFVSGTTGYDYELMAMPESVAAQAENCFSTIASVLEQAGFSLRDVVRVGYVVRDPAAIDEVTPVLERWLGDLRPAATMIVAGLIRPEMKIEIEVTAFRG